MAVDAVAAPARAHERLSFSERVAAIPTYLVLGGLVAASFAVRFVAALAHAVPVYFPDEYIYGSLARGLAESGRPVVREGAAHFPALLEPLLAAPFWLFGDPVLAYRLTQAENALAMSLAAIPVYLLARRLDLSRPVALGAAGLAVASPDLVFSSFVLADPIAYPLVLGAICAGVHALARPARGAQLTFLALAGLATFTRVQYVVLPVAFFAASLVVERGRVAQAFRSVRMPLALAAVPVVAITALGPARALGYYSGIFDQRLSPGGLLHWTSVDVMLLAYAAGWILVPGALVGLALAVWRPRSRAEAAFAGLTAAFAGLLLVEAALYASNGSERFQERYLFTLLPLVPLLFGLYAARDRPGRRAVFGLAAAMTALAASVPLSGYTVGGNKQDSPFLFAVFRLEQALGTETGSLAVALAAAVLAGFAVLVAIKRRGATVIAFVLTGMVAAAMSGAAGAVHVENSHDIRRDYLPADRQWVDHAALGDALLLQTPGAPAARALEQLFWNRSVRSVGLLPGAAPPDLFRTLAVTVARDGTLLERGRPIRRPLLVENFAVGVELAGATRAATGGSFDLWRPLGTPRLSVLALGRYYDGWLAPKGQLGVWPDATGRVEGTLRIAVALPPAADPLTLRVRARGVDRSVRMAAGTRRVLTFEVSAPGPWSLRFAASSHGSLWDGRPVSLRVEGPVFERAPRRAAPATEASSNEVRA